MSARRCRPLVLLAAAALGVPACHSDCPSGWRPTPTTCGVPDASLPSSLPDTLDVPDAPTDTPDDAPDDVQPDAVAPDVVDASTDAAPNVVATDWVAGSLTSSPLPDRSLLLPLPGEGVGGPVVTSNNPEAFDADGLLYSTRPSPTRGGTSYPLTGDFGAYIHHTNRNAVGRYVSLVMLNPGNAGVVVTASGSGYTSDETGATSPDYRVSDEWINQRPATRLASTVLAPGTAVIAFQKPVGQGRELDGRFAMHSSGPVHVLVVASTAGDLASVLAAAATDAPGNTLTSGTPPPPYGREAGTYAHDTWLGTVSAQVPVAGHFVGLMVNTATGTGLSQIQAFPALTNFAESAREAVGMYGNVYDLTVVLAHDGDGTATRHVRFSFGSYGVWNGAALVDGQDVSLVNNSSQHLQVLSDVTVAPGAPHTIRLRAMVPGLAAIPQAVFLESY